MCLISEHRGKYYFSCMRDLTPEERQWLVDNWAAYKKDAKAWVEWAKANLQKNTFFVGHTEYYNNHQRQRQAGIDWLLKQQYSLYDNP